MEKSNLIVLNALVKYIKQHKRNPSNLFHLFSILLTKTQPNFLS